VLARVSCNINFPKKFAIGRQDRKRNPAIVRSGEGEQTLWIFHAILVCKNREIFVGESTEYAGSSSVQRNIIIVRREHASKSMRSDISRGQLGRRKKRKEWKFLTRNSLMGLHCKITITIITRYDYSIL